MDEYIKREAAVDAVAEAYYDTPTIYLTMGKLEVAIGGIPAADVAPVVHGRWIHDGRRFRSGVDWCHCSECGRKDDFAARTNYCPNCGAKMDGGMT